MIFSIGQYNYAEKSCKLLIFLCNTGFITEVHVVIRYLSTVASFPGLPSFSSLVCIQYNTRKWKSVKNGELRFGLLHPVSDVRWTRCGHDNDVRGRD